MILTTLEELNALLPANVSTRPERLLTLMEQTERTHIVPLLGKPLYKAVCDEYTKLHNSEAVDANGEPMNVNSLVTAESDHLGFSYTPMQQLIRLLQVPLVYMTLADNTGILSVSLNDGGMNMVSAESYDAAKKDDREAFSRDCFRNAHKGMEQVLLFLEEDAHTEQPVFLDLWSQSPTFYLQYGLLVPTAYRFNQFVPIDDSRELFLTLVQRIRHIQDNRIRTEIGETLTDALVQYAAFGPQSKPSDQLSEVATTAGTERSDGSANSEAHSQQNSSFFILHSSFEEDLRSYLPVKRYPGMTPEERIKLNGWSRLLTLLQSAVCFYVEMDNKKLCRPSSDKDAMLALERAKQFVQNNTALFEGVIEDSPLYQSPIEDPSEAKGQQGCSTNNSELKTHNSDGVVFDPLGSYYP